MRFTRMKAKLSGDAPGKTIELQADNRRRP
jgi:hypothetical protein